nr:putative F-box protein At4g10190 [Tanacetum cinerariifolium]
MTRVLMLILMDGALLDTFFYLAIVAACQAIWLREGLAEVMENEQVIVEHVSGENERADSLTKALARIRFKEMRLLLRVQELLSST